MAQRDQGALRLDRADQAILPGDVDALLIVGQPARKHGKRTLSRLQLGAGLLQLHQLAHFGRTRRIAYLHQLCAQCLQLHAGLFQLHLIAAPLQLQGACAHIGQGLGGVDLLALGVQQLRVFLQLLLEGRACIFERAIADRKADPRRVGGALFAVLQRAQQRDLLFEVQQLALRGIVGAIAYGFPRLGGLGAFVPVLQGCQSAIKRATRHRAIGPEIDARK